MRSQVLWKEQFRRSAEVCCGEIGRNYYNEPLKSTAGLLGRESTTVRSLLGATKILVGPANEKKLKGATVTFHCEARFDDSILKHGIKWQRGGRDITESDDTDKYFISNTTLTITDLEYSDQGLYSCVAWTSLDSVKKSARLLVAGKSMDLSKKSYLITHFSCIG
uniref:Uncharacterized protein n=1 Tax=Sphaerodactylus townsendi TaxID=933632 RepID=A0ACB8ELJ1_9SAUR